MGRFSVSKSLAGPVLACFSRGKLVYFMVSLPALKIFAVCYGLLRVSAS
jgi:hypothetical protein